jgi:hypothetical protein
MLKVTLGRIEWLLYERLLYERLSSENTRVKTL